MLSIQYAKSQDWIRTKGLKVTLLEAGFVATGYGQLHFVESEIADVG